MENTSPYLLPSGIVFVLEDELNQRRLLHEASQSVAFSPALRDGIEAA